jgi:hypothetical protein
VHPATKQPQNQLKQGRKLPAMPVYAVQMRMDYTSQLLLQGALQQRQLAMQDTTAGQMLTLPLTPHMSSQRCG